MAACQDRLRQRDKTCPARTQLIMSWKALLLFIIITIVIIIITTITITITVIIIFVIITIIIIVMAAGLQCKPSVAAFTVVWGAT
jgi:Flp pilus assembly protein TadB